MGLSRIKSFQKIRELYLRETADSFLKNCQKLLILDSPIIMPSKEIQAAINKIRAAKGASVYLDLECAFREEDDAKCIAEGIKEARAPLTLDLDIINMAHCSSIALQKAAEEARVPIDLCDDGYGDDGIFVLDAGHEPSRFFAKLKFNPFSLLGLRPILTQAPVVKELLELNYLKDIAFIIQEYIPDSKYLAWKVVEAIRAVEGASRKNKYYSINYELLTEVYSTAPAHNRKQSSNQEAAAEEEEFKGQGMLAYTGSIYPEYYNSGLDRALKLRLSELTNSVSLKSRYFGHGLFYEARAFASDVGAILS
jgi:hypothetical protein